jgi:hypothetical protein
MFTEVTKWFSIAALSVALMFWNYAPTYQGELKVVVSAAAVVVLIQAFKAKKYRWAAGFLGLALLFNPAMTVFRLAGSVSLSLVVLAIAPFAISLIALRPHPLLSMPSITDRNPRSQSL